MFLCNDLFWQTNFRLWAHAVSPNADLTNWTMISALLERECIQPSRPRLSQRLLCLFFLVCELMCSRSDNQPLTSTYRNLSFKSVSPINFSERMFSDNDLSVLLFVGCESMWIDCHMMNTQQFFPGFLPIGRKSAHNFSQNRPLTVIIGTFT